jgi:hypothetical protein
MINEEFWNRELKQFEIPKFQCPVCQKGLLISNKEKLIEGATKESECLYEVTGEPEYYEGHFTAISRCNNPDCEEITTIVGETKTIQDGWDDGRDPDTFEDIHEPYPTYKLIYLVNYTNPAIRLMKFPRNTPKEIIEIIDESFKLFWVDEDSCGNKIRSGIEKLLDLQKVNKTTMNKQGKRQPLNLHQRIDNFKSKEPEIAKYFFALKWIGNQGSHNGGYKLSRKELIDAYRILEVSLIDLYDKTRIEVNKLATKINKKKKHRAK